LVDLFELYDDAQPCKLLDFPKAHPQYPV